MGQAVRMNNVIRTPHSVLRKMATGDEGHKEVDLQFRGRLALYIPEPREAGLMIDASDGTGLYTCTCCRRDFFVIAKTPRCHSKQKQVLATVSSLFSIFIGESYAFVFVPKKLELQLFCVARAFE